MLVYHVCVLTTAQSRANIWPVKCMLAPKVASVVFRSNAVIIPVLFYGGPQGRLAIVARFTALYKYCINKNK